MKVYPLRMEDEMMEALKAVGLKEKKSLKAIIMEALQEKIWVRVKKSQSLKEQKALQRAAVLAGRLSDERLVASIREDRER